MSERIVDGKSMPDSVSSSPEEGHCVSTTPVPPQRADAQMTTHGPSGLWALVGRTVPTTAVLFGLVGLGYWGHRSDWKIPKFSELNGTARTDTDDWCAEHSVPESICVACKAELMPKGPLHGWCKEHGIAECTLEHAEVAQLKEVPAVSQADLERARRAIDLKPRAENDPTCKLHLRRIQFASAHAADKAGIDIALVDRAPIVESILANGEVIYDP